LSSTAIEFGAVNAAGFVSPHFDDAVLSCGLEIASLPEGTVITVFSGGPERVAPLPLWDRECGFTPGYDVTSVRAQEDDAALAQLDARARRLGFWDGQYRARAPNRFVRAAQRELGDRRLPSRISEAVGATIPELGLETIFVPLGVGHPDHKLVAKACLAAARRLPELQWLVYEDLPYAAESAQSREAALAAIAAAGFRLEPALIEPTAAPERKRAAVECYTSQLKALGARAQLALDTPEQYHRLARR
jgi:LmbE family N-acetylglucosaminyl deacetylase